MAFDQSKTTDASGLATFTAVPVGTDYTLAQNALTAIDGYVLYSNTTFTVTEGMTAYDVEIVPEVGNVFTLTATVVDNSLVPVPLPGVVFNVFADAAKTMQLGGNLTSDVNGEFTVPFLVGASGIGRNYYISQVSAPAGYVIAADVTITVLYQEQPDPIAIVNITNDVPIKVQDANYPNMVFGSIDMTLSHT